MKSGTLVLIMFLIIGCSRKASSPSEVGADWGDAEVEAEAEAAAEVVDAEVEEGDQSDLVDWSEDGELGDAQTEGAEADAAQGIAERFVAAGGQTLCEAMVFGLNPDWRLESCDRKRTAERRDACRRRRAPIARYVQDICSANIEEALRLDMDPALGLAVMQRESGMGRRFYDREAYVYRIGTDREALCRMFLSYDRIVCGLTGVRDCDGAPRLGRRNAKFACWTYGDENRKSCQGVLEVAVAETGVTIDTCVAGEFGVFQLLPANYRAGTVIESTGEVLTGTRQKIEDRLVHDVTLQVRLGYQELAAHRAIAPQDRQEDWIDWLPLYNIGRDCLLPKTRCTDRQKRHWWVYLLNVSRHYLQACQGWWMDEDGPAVLVKDVWPECGRIEELRSAFAARMRGL